MPSFTYPNTFSDTATSDADDVMENLYTPQTTTPNSLDIINGSLDAVNKASDDNLSRRKVQPFTFARPSMVGATANLDFLEDRWWQGVDLTSGDPDAQFLPIPGGSIQYYQPWDASIVLICWQISWGTDSGANTTNTPIKLFTSTTGSLNATRRQASHAVSGGVRYGKGTDMFYQGHYALLSETAGWKQASLRICSDAEQTRVRVRNMIVIPFR